MTGRRRRAREKRKKVLRAVGAADLEIHMERFSLKRTKQSELVAEVSGGCKAVNVFITVIKLMAAVIYMILSLFLIDYGYEDYLMNRGGIVPAGCLLALFILQFLMGETVLPVYGAIRWKGFAFEAGSWMLSFFVVFLCSVDIHFFVESMDFETNMPGYIVTAAVLMMVVAMLMELSLYPYSFFSGYGKKRVSSFLIPAVGMTLWALLVPVICRNLDMGGPLPLAGVLLPAVSFLAGFLRYLTIRGGNRKGKTGKRRRRLKEAAVALPAGVILIGLKWSGMEELPEIMPRQDENGYYLLCTRESFEWFIHRINLKNEEHNVNARLTADIVLNDTENWEHWEEEPPENAYRCMVYYSGHFDGDGYALEGYYSEWEMPVFNILEEQALVTDLKIRNSLFRSTYETNRYDDDGEINMVPASALCYASYGRIESCDVEAAVYGDWGAGGIASINRGEMGDCRFSGEVRAGRWYCADRGDDRWAIATVSAGGICKTNEGTIRNCVNEGNVLCDAITDTYPVDYAVGGIAGKVSNAGRLENCGNVGSIRGPQLSGGIAGASRGEIYRCVNTGEVLVEQAKLDYTVSLITAGICASNGGLVDSCWNTGEVLVHQEFLSFYAPVYGIACNLVNPERGQTKNCYYLANRAKQDYRQFGVYKLSETEMAEVEKYVAAGESAGDRKEKALGQDAAAGGNEATGENAEAGDIAAAKQEAGKGNDGIADRYVISDVDSWELFTAIPDFPGTDEDDYIHLHMGPKQDTAYEVQPGDTLWKIAENFYGDGMYYDKLICPEDLTGGFADSDLLYPGEKIQVPGLDYYLLCANDEEGFDWAFCQDASGEKCPTRYFMAKPEDWYYGNMNFVANWGLDVLWPKNKEAGQAAAAGDIRILYYLDGNPEGDFLADEWESAKEKIAESAGIYCGQGIENLHFYRYGLDNGESLYGYSFRLYPDQCPYESKLREDETAQVFLQAGPLNCAVFWRMREGLVAEFIGIEPAAADMDVLARTRYLAARVVDGPAIEKTDYTGEEFYGREDWAYTKLHNPFAVALEYSPDMECSDYMLFTGAQ